MPGKRAARVLRAKAFAKINLTLRVLGIRSDGHHELRTVFQSLDLHDTLTFITAPEEPARAGAQRLCIECTDPACPTDRTNLVWRAAERVWRAANRRGQPSGVRIRLVKKIPMQAGLGGGSSDAAAALRALAVLWGVKGGPSEAALRGIAARLGADVPFFLEGGTALGVERGDRLFALAEWPSSWVVLVLPSFGVTTKDAFGWFDQASASVSRARAPQAPPFELWNDLQAPVAARYPEIGRIVRSLRRAGASYAAMSGSGSAVFGLFASRAQAESAACRLSGRGRRTILTRTLSRSRFQARSRAM